MHGLKLFILFVLMAVSQPLVGFSNETVPIRFSCVLHYIDQVTQNNVANFNEDECSDNDQEFVNFLSDQYNIVVYHPMIQNFAVPPLDFELSIQFECVGDYIQKMINNRILNTDLKPILTHEGFAMAEKDWNGYLNKNFTVNKCSAVDQKFADLLTSLFTFSVDSPRVGHSY